MNNADKMRDKWITEYGPVYGPYPCYDRWMVRAWVLVGVVCVAVAWWVVR